MDNPNTTALYPRYQIPVFYLSNSVTERLRYLRGRDFELDQYLYSHPRNCLMQGRWFFQEEADFVVESIVLSTQISTNTLELPYFDMLIRLHPEERPLTRDELPATRFRRQIYDTAEPAQVVLASGEFGIVEFLGINENSAFFAIASDKLQGRRAIQSNEIVVPQSFAEHAGFVLQDSVGITTVQPVVGKRAEMRIVGIYDAEGGYTPVLCSNLFYFTSLHRAAISRTNCAACSIQGTETHS